ncbi:NAD-dependent epimerase/dehydratase family protein, partial [Candidatus Dependentiae bacterium]|nr:NAD-dependent epimerase/dehydratase family protein [Candidatus Dependentiae bacterium]
MIKPKEKILVTGASGFIGSFLCHYLLTEGFQVFGLYLTNPISNPEIISKTIDIRDKDSILDYIVKNEINFVVHLAYKKGREMEETIVNGTKNLAEICRKFNIGFLLMSTDIVFDGMTGDYSEEIKPKPIIDYGKFK